MAGQRSGELPYHLSKEALQKDLTDERPPWILSSFGPGKDAPEQLFGGYPREQSFEELRLHYNNAVAAGNPQSAINEINGLYRIAEQQIQNTLNNMDAAIQYIVDAGNKHPNRLDICRRDSLPGGTSGVFSRPEEKDNFGGQMGAFAAAGQSLKPFASTNQTTSGAFGQPSALGSKPNPFGSPAFGQSSPPTGASAFGQPSRLGGSGVSAFGQTSTLGAKPSPFGTPAFGQPSQPSSTSGFGQPSQPSGAPAFGQPSQPTGASAFGQPSQPAGTPAFGQPAQLGGASPFGQPSALGAKPNPFGTSSTTNASPFITLGGGGAQTANPPPQNLFAKPDQTTSPFGATSTSAPSPFGQPSGANAFNQPALANPFGKPAQITSPFSTTAQPTDNSSSGARNPFGAPSAPSAASPFSSATSTTTGFGQPTGPGNPFGAPSAQALQPSATPASPTTGGPGTNPYGPHASRTHPSIQSYSSHNPDGSLRMFKGKAVVYSPLKGSTAPVPMVRSFDGSTTRIWFPEGPPAYTAETELPEADYDEKSRTQWKGFVEAGKFVGGVMPEMPPRREWCVWDF